MHGSSAVSPVNRVAIYSLILNLLLVAVKLSLSFITGSLTLRADGIHSLVDVFASVALILGLVISGRRSEDFPYGLYKVENVVSVVISLLLFLTAYDIAMEALGGTTVTLPASGWILGVLALIIPVPYLFGRYQVRIGREYNSPSLIADGTQHMVDVLSSTVVFFALLGQYADIPLDAAAAVIIALFIFRAGWEILKSGMRVLLDASVDHDTLDAIRTVIMAEPVVTRILRVTGRNSGRYIFVEADVEVRLKDLERAHAVSQRIEQSIATSVPNVDRVIIHYEPQKKSVMRYAVALEDRQGTISMHFGDAPYFSFIDFSIPENRILREEILVNSYTETEKGKGIKVAEMLLAKKPDAMVSRGSLIGKGPGFAFSDAGVELIRTGAETSSQFADELVSGEMTEP